MWVLPRKSKSSYTTINTTTSTNKTNRPTAANSLKTKTKQKTARLQITPTDHPCRAPPLPPPPPRPPSAAAAADTRVGRSVVRQPPSVVPVSHRQRGRNSSSPVGRSPVSHCRSFAVARRRSNGYGVSCITNGRSLDVGRAPPRHRWHRPVGSFGAID